MNDDFLQPDYQTPSNQFGQTLLDQLHQNDRQQQKTRRRMATLAAIPLLLILLAFTSPTVRAAFEKQFFLAGQSLTVITEMIDSGYQDTFPSHFMTYDEAREQSDFKLPKSIPDGFSPAIVRSYDNDFSEIEESVAAFEKGTEFVRYTYFPDSGVHFYSLQWNDDTQNVITLSVSDNQTGSLIVGDDKAKEVVIRDGVVGLTNLGGWEGEDYLSTGDNTLRWVEDGWVYDLASFAETVTLEMLIEIANSFE